MCEEFFVNDKYIKLAIALKANQLKREELSSITHEHVENILYGYIWQYHPPRNVYAAVKDILSLNANEVIQYLSSHAMIAGSKMNIHDFSDLIGGKKE